MIRAALFFDARHQALLASCGDNVVGLRDAALISLANDAGLRVSELGAVYYSDTYSR